MTEARVPTSADMQWDKVRGILQKGIELVGIKGHDYASEDSAFTNFIFTGMVLDYAISRGLKGPDLAFLSLIATKIGRVIELRGSDKTPKNETIEDTCVDQAVYDALWGGWILTKQQPLLGYHDVEEFYREEEPASQAEIIVTLRKDISKLLQAKGCEVTLSELASYEYPDLDLEAAKEATGFKVCWPITCYDGVTRTKEEYAEWTKWIEGKKGVS